MTTDGRAPSAGSFPLTDTAPRLAESIDDQPTDPAARPTGAPRHGGRHARRDVAPPPSNRPRLDYIPRHSAELGLPDQVSPTEVTDVLARVRQDPTESPRAARPHSTPEPPGEPELEDAEPVLVGAKIELVDRRPVSDSLPPGKRVRVVLSQRKGQARPVRTVVDVQELTQVGEVLSSSLIKSQFWLSVRLGAVALIGLAGLPVLFYFWPKTGWFELFGLRLPWLLLGVVAYPFMVLIGWMYSRAAEKVEQIFADYIQS